MLKQIVITIQTEYNTYVHQHYLNKVIVLLSTMWLDDKVQTYFKVTTGT